MTIANKIVFAIVTAVTGSLATKTLHNTWTRVTGDEPPNLTDPNVPAHRALAWVVLSGLMLAGTQIFLNRLGARRWHAKAKPIAVRIGK